MAAFTKLFILSTSSSDTDACGVYAKPGERVNLNLFVIDLVSDENGTVYTHTATP
jgi:hypothetical protein